MTDLVYFGTMTRPHGVRGEMKIESDFDEQDGVLKIRSYFYTDQDKVIRKLSVRGLAVHHGYLLASFEEIPDRNEAEKYRMVQLYVHKDELSLPDHISLVEDLIGSRIVSVQNGHEIGKIIDVIHLPSQDVYMLNTPDGTGMIPALLRIFPRFEKEQKTIYADEAVFRSCFCKNES